MRAGTRTRCLAIAGLTAFVLAYAFPSRAGERLVPHEATYDLTLDTSVGDGQISALKGTMEARFVESCDGWRIEQALAFRMLTRDGDRLEHLAHFNAFEERGGTGLVFNARTWEDRELVEELSGTARRRADGRVHVAHAMPEPRTEILPPGTLFPTEHVATVLGAALDGRRLTMSTVFDGSSSENPFQISSVIGLPVPARPDAPGALSGRRAWPVRLAYFALGAVAPEPDFEMSVLLYANGVAGDMVYDYGDFAIDVRLRDVRLFDAPTCP